MNKFEGPDDGDYGCVAGKIEEFCREIREGSPLKRAGDHIRNTAYTDARLNIERLSGEALSMDQCYINLAIVEPGGENAARSEDEDAASQPPPPSLFAQLKVEKPSPKIEVELPKIFSDRKDRDGGTIQPRRILIRGQAGVGKTTLCKKIVHDFIRHRTWNDLFNLIIWVPLRRLKGRQVAGYNMEDLFRDDFVAHHLDHDLLANALWRTVNTNSRKTLFVLDGLDEVSDGLGQDHKMFSFLENLLNQPNAIITSRPFGELPAWLKPLDIQLETIGFYPDQVNGYLNKAFSDPKTASDVRSFLHDHRLLQGLVRIPIQLDALCYTWDERSGDQTIPETMAAIYKAIERSLWKKDIVHLGIKDGGELVTRTDIRTASPSTVEGLVKHEISLLEGLAFTGLHNGVFDFESKHLCDVSGCFAPCLLLDKTLPRLSFLRTSDPSPEGRNRTYHFLHLTFQEYFAARYFVRQWKAKNGGLKCLDLRSGKTEEIDHANFLRKHKYKAQYNRSEEHTSELQSQD